MAKTKVIRIPLKVVEEIAYLAKGEGKTKAEFLEELFDPIMQLCSRHDTNKFNLVFEIQAFPNPQLTIKTEGKSSFVIGEFTEAELEKLRKEQFDTLKLDIAEAREKQVKAK